MNPLKLGAIILILTAGLAGGHLIIKDSKTAGSGSYITLESSGKAPENPPKSPIQWMEKAKEFISNPIESFGLNESSKVSEVKSSNDETPLNLTEFVAKSVSNQMQTLDQKGVENINPNDPQNQEAIEKAMAELQNFSLFDELISDSDLKISQDNSLEAKKRYLTETAQIIIKNSNEAYNNPQKALEKMANTLDISGVKQAAEAYSEILNGFLNTEVPSDYLNLHKRYIILLKKAKEVYQGLVDYSNDPVRAALSMQLVQKIAEAELKIKQEYYQKSLNP
ncbi:MAG: hypothetical protein KKA81_16925 [Bacteroidetes bacterium]|nr:hypothetical protein [Bacteroidota bacterium]